MKKTVLVSLFVFISFLANAQNWKSHPKKPYSGTDSCLVWQDSTKRFYRIKCSEIGGGGSVTDTTKEYRIAQGRGSTPFLLYFNGTAWVKNDTSYVPQSGTNKFSGNLLSNQSFLQVGLGSSNNTLTFADEVFTGIKSASATSETQISAYSTTNGYADISVYNPLGGLYDRRMVITGTGNNTPDQSFRIQNGLLYYFGNYTSQMTDDRTVPDIGKVKQLISDSVGTVQSTTLADGKIWIGDGTDTAFPRTLSGDVTVSNLGVTSYNGIVPSTKGGAGAVNGILKANGSGVVSAATAGTDYISPLSLQTFDVNDYGATGNGSTDDLTAINSAITAVVANGGGVLLFRKGTYRVTAPITITGSNIIVTTLNKGTSIFLNFTTNAPNFNLIGNNNIISDLKFTGDQVFRSNGHTVYLRGNDNTVTRCTVVGSSCFSVYVGASGTSINTKIHQNHIYNSAADGIHASVGVTRCDIYDNYIHDVADDGIGIGHEGSASEVNIFSNNIVNTGSRGITIMGGSRLINVSSNNITNTWLGGLYVECYTGSVSLVNITANNVYLAGAYTPPLALNARGSGVGGGIVVMAGTNGGSYGITSLSISNNNISSSWNSHIGIGYVNNGSSVFGISSLKVTGNICYGITNVGARGAALGTGGGVNAAPSPLSYAGIYVANSFNLDVSNNSINACNQEVVRIGSTCTGYNTVKNNFCITPNQSGGANYAYYVEAGLSDILDNSVSLNGSTITGILLNSSQSVSSSNNSSSSIVNYSKYDGSSSGNPSYTALGTGSNIGINQISKGNASNQSLGNSNTVIGYVAQNTQAGTSAGSSLVVKNNNNTLQADLRINSTTFTTADLLAANQAYLLTTSNYLGIGSSAASGIFEIITGGTTYSNRRFKIDNGGNICTNSTASVLYRTTNAGSDIAAHFMNDPANSLSSGIAYGWSVADGQFYTQGNGTRRIKGAAVVPTSTSATPGSEGMDLVFQTQTGGAAAAQRLRIGATAITISDAVNLVLNTTTGTKIGTATTQKLAFYNSTPIVQPANTIAINDVLVNLGLRASGGSSNFTSDLKLDNVGTGFYVKEGTNATMGTATLASGTVTVSTTKVTANSRIYLTINGGTLTNVGTPYISARSAGTNFTISSTNVLDASNVAWVIVEPN